MSSSKLERFVTATQIMAPGFKVVRKKDSKLMRFTSWLVYLWCPDFMDNYATTIGNIVYLPDSVLKYPNNISTITLLAHELRHVTDKQNYGAFIYALMYLFPQILAVFALGALGAIWGSNHWLWFLTSLLFLAPLPAPGRMYIERRGYTMNLAVNYWLYAEHRNWVQNPTIVGVVGHFTGPDYYFMWPWKSKVLAMFEKEFQRIYSDVNLDSIDIFTRDFVLRERSS
jgi:hypothetical protein